jgi:hypothetical protein
MTTPAQLAASFSAMSARRLLVFGGIALIAAGLLFGDLFAVFVLHQNAGEQGAALVAAAQAVARQDVTAVNGAFQHLGSLLEGRGTKVDTHVHMLDAGYLALLLALVQPYVALGASTKKKLAAWFITGGVTLPVGIFLIHYVGLAYSPFPVIGWASVLADLGGLVLIVVLVIEAVGVVRYLRSGRAALEPELPHDCTWTRRALLSGGTLLVLLGFVGGAHYAAKDLYRHERMEPEILTAMLQDAANNGAAELNTHVNHFGGLAGEKAVKLAAHAHFVEFGLLAMLLSFLQPYVMLSERWQRRWVVVLLAGSVILPVFVFLELRFGLIAGGIADFGGLLVLIALIAMLVGVLRYTGNLDSAGGAA